MADHDVTIRIKAEDQTKQGFDSAKKNAAAAAGDVAKTSAKFGPPANAGPDMGRYRDRLRQVKGELSRASADLEVSIFGDKAQGKNTRDAEAVKTRIDALLTEVSGPSREVTIKLGVDGVLKAAAQAKELKNELDAIGKKAGEAAEEAKPGDKEEPKGLLGRLGRWFKEQKREKRTSGENALKEAMARGPEGLVDAAMDRMGQGLNAMAADMIGKGFANATGRAVEMRNAVREGRATMGELVAETAKEIPVLGGWIAGWMNVRELMTGEKALLQQQIDFTQQVTRSQEAYTKAVQETQMARKRDNEELARGNREIAGIGLKGLRATMHAIESRHEEEKGANEIGRMEARNAALNDPEKRAANETYADWQTKNGKRLQQLSDYEQAEKNAKPTDIVYMMDDNEKKELAELRSQEEHLKGITRRANAAVEQRMKDRLKTLDAKDKQADERKAKDTKYAEAEDIKRREFEMGGEANANRQSAGETEAARLVNEGKQREAALKELETRTQAAKDAAALERDQRLHANKGNRAAEADAEKAYKDKTAAIDAKAAQDRELIEWEHGKKKKEIALQSAEAVKDAEAQANAEKLRETGQAGEAEIALLKRNAERRKAEIKQDAELRAEKDVENAPAIRKQAEAQAKAIDAQTAKETRDRQRNQQQEQFGQARNLIDARVGALQMEAKAGNFAAAAEEKRLRIVAEFAEKRQRLSRMLTDENVSKEQKDLAKSELGKLDRQQEMATKLANFTGGTPLATMVMGGRMSGAAARAAEENSTFIQMNKLMKSSNESLAQIKAATEAMAKVFSGNPTVAPLFKSIMGG